SALRQWQAHPPAQPLTPADLIGLLADAEWVSRENRKLTARLKAAKLKLPACVEDVDYRHPRGLTKTLLVDLGTSRWVAAHETVADAICDRLVHGAHRIKLTGESLRKGLTNGTKPAK